MKKTLAVMLVVMFAFAAMPGTVFAASPWTEAETYNDQVGQKLGFGLKNMLLGWTEVAAEPARANKAGTDSVKGMMRGAANFVMYTLGGAVHAVTFLIPVDVPLPNNGVQIDLGVA